jgi:predicted  nucleic acid-binding Zn-ribbon protein
MLAQLVELSNINGEIDSYEPMIAAIRKDLEVLLEKRQEMEQKIMLLEEEITDCDNKKRKNELHLVELTDKLKDIAAKGSDVKNEREVKALQLEEDIAREQIDFANEEIERFDTIKSSKAALIDDEKTKIETITQEIGEKEADVIKEVERVESSRVESYRGKEQLVSDMNPKILAFYEKIRKWAGNTTLVPVKKQACYGCFMTINDKTYTDIIIGEEIVTCPHCGRILYIEPEEAKEEA